RRHTRFSRDWSSDVCSSDLFPDCELKPIAIPSLVDAASCPREIQLGPRIRAPSPITTELSPFKIVDDPITTESIPDVTTAPLPATKFLVSVLHLIAERLLISCVPIPILPVIIPPDNGKKGPPLIEAAEIPLS